MERVKWLCDLLQLLRSSPPPPQMTMEEGPAPTTTARRLQMKYHAEFLSSCKSVANLCTQWRMRMKRSQIFYMGRGIVHSFVPKLKQGGFLVSEATNELI
jgi:hypothetical protein